MYVKETEEMVTENIQYSPTTAQFFVMVEIKRLRNKIFPFLFVISNRGHTKSPWLRPQTEHTNNTNVYQFQPKSPLTSKSKHTTTSIARETAAFHFGVHQANGFALIFNLNLQAIIRCCIISSFGIVLCVSVMRWIYCIDRHWWHRLWLNGASPRSRVSRPLRRISGCVIRNPCQEFQWFLVSGVFGYYYKCDKVSVELIVTRHTTCRDYEKYVWKLAGMWSDKGGNLTWKWGTSIMRVELFIMTFCCQ